jgi:hypothetical protein
MRITVVGGGTANPLVRRWEPARGVLDALLDAHAQHLPRLRAAGVRVRP